MRGARAVPEKGKRAEKDRRVEERRQQRGPAQAREDAAV